jgi:hypothetical protein
MRGTVADAQFEVALRRELARQFDASDESGRHGARVVSRLRARPLPRARHRNDEGDDGEDSQQEAPGASTRFDSTHGYCRFPKG